MTDAVVTRTSAISYGPPCGGVPSRPARLRRRHHPVSVLALAAVLVCAANARADEFQPPRTGLVACYMRTLDDRPEKDRVQYSVVGLKGDEAVLEIAGRLEKPYRIHTYRGIHTYLSVSPDVEVQEAFDRRIIDSFGRLEAGKTVKIDITRTTRQGTRTEVQDGTFTLAVEGKERISVPAGEFSTWVVLRRIETRNKQTGARYRQDRRSWYVSDLGWFARLQLVGGSSAGSSGRLDLLWLSEAAGPDRQDLCESHFASLR